MVRQPQELVDRLRARVAPAALRGGPQDPVVVLGQGHAVALAIDLGRGRQDHAGPPLPRRPEEDLRPRDVGLDRPHRPVQDQSHTDRGRQVVDHVGARDHLPHEGLVRDRPHHHLEPGVALHGRQVAALPRREVVQDDHLVARHEERLREVRPDEAGPARDERSHARARAGQSRTTRVRSTLTSRVALRVSNTSRACVTSHS